MKNSFYLSSLLVASVVMGCSEREEIFAGPRFNVRAPLEDVAKGGEVAAAEEEARVKAEIEAGANPSRVKPILPDVRLFGARTEMVGEPKAIKLPAIKNHASWTHKNGAQTHRIQHPGISSAPSLIWSADIGAGENRKVRFAGDPVAVGNLIYTMDTGAMVTATTSAGVAAWSVSLVPASDKEGQASPGALSIGDGKLFATSGFGELVAMDLKTGAIIWRQKTGGAVTGSATISGGLVYVVSRDGRGWALDTDDGRIKWQMNGLGGTSVRVGGAGPTITDRSVVFPFGSGEISAALRKSGITTWRATVSGERRGRAYAGVTDITADPVLDGNKIYTGNASGRVVAIDAFNGERIWTANEGAIGPVWPAGGSLFLISDQSQLVRLDAKTGEVIWSRSLPYFVRDKIKKRRAIFGHYGPVLAGGRIWVASEDKVLKAFDPASGDMTYTTDLPSGAASAPIVVNGTMYIISKSGNLLAYR